MTDSRHCVQGGDGAAALHEPNGLMVQVNEHDEDLYL